MKVFALSDIHVDYEVNAQWVAGLSLYDYRDDVLILAGDVSDCTDRLQECVQMFAKRFRQVLYVPGNHDIWVRRQPQHDSLEKFRLLCKWVEDCGASTHIFHEGGLSIVPLFGWYDYSFGEPGPELLNMWMDYRACRWPHRMHPREVAEHFCELNRPSLQVRNETVISFSHFLPRIDLMPWQIPAHKRFLYPVLGTQRLERQIRQLGSKIHVYGHSHVNRRVTLDGVSYVNNAFGYPNETHIAGRKLLCVHER